MQKRVMDFSCGNYVIDNFIKSSEALDHSQGITYVMLAGNEAVGFYNITTGRVDREEMINGQNYYWPMGGSIHINYFAIDQNYQRRKIDDKSGCYLSDYMLEDCEQRILELRESVGFAFITLYSTERGYYFYHNRNEYENFEEDMSIIQNESDVGCIKLYKWIEYIQG